MKNFNIMGVCWKIRLLGGGGGGGVPKNQGLKRGGGWDSFQIWGGRAKKEGGGLIP